MKQPNHFHMAVLIGFSMVTLSSCEGKQPPNLPFPDMGTLIWCLVLAGIMAGLANYFLTYLGLPTVVVDEVASDGKQALIAGEAGEGDNQNWPRRLTELKAVFGYVTVGICGALLTPVMNAIVQLKGLEISNGTKSEILYYLIAFGYGIIFGYSANRLFTSAFTALEARIVARLKVVEKENAKVASLLKSANMSGKVFKQTNSDNSGKVEHMQS